MDDRLPGPLLQAAGGRRIALLGEASHGTQEFHEIRAQLTRHLVEERGCRAIVVEGGWPDAWRIDRWVRGLEGGSASDALARFERFPAWMWRNAVVRDFIVWLRAHNASRPPWEQVGFYGMDPYNLFGSVRAVLDHLDRTDPEAARRARRRYACFDHFQQDLQAYGYAAGFGTASCEDAVVARLRDLLARRRVDGDDPDALFHAQQNARLVKNAEPYYRGMFRGRASSWNLRDLHMAETVEALSAHLQDRAGQPPRMAIWAHNSHLGDASATGMGEQGEWNVGQLLRQRWPHDVFLLGFTTHEGTVRAASEWDAPEEIKAVSPGLAGSWEALFHAAGGDRFALLPGADPGLRELLDADLLERAIGVIYLPRTERRSHYFGARIGVQFDAVVHVDRTRALEVLPSAGGASVGVELPEASPAFV